MCEDLLEPLRWSVERGADGATVVTLTGELDMDQVGRVAALADHLTGLLVDGDGAPRGDGDGAGPVPPVTVDCHGLSFIDSSGYVALVMLARQLGDAGSSVALRRAPAHMIRSHSLLGLDGVLPLER